MDDLNARGEAGWPAELDYRYDRRVSEEFLELFVPGGVLQNLTEYARKAPYPVDLHFRRDIKSDAQRATLYVGLEKVLDVHWRRGMVGLVGHRTRATDHGFDAAWGTWMPTAAVASFNEAMELYLDTVIPPTAASRAGVEGAVQSAVSSFDSTARAMLDREFILQFRDSPTRSRVMQEVTADLLEAAADAPVPGHPPATFGGECDLVAVDSDGRLLAIEVKPRGAADIPWAPLQVIVYARLLTRWMRDDPAAAGILNGIAAQRRALGLLTDEAPTIAADAPVVPFLAIQRGMKPVYRERLAAMHEHLRASGIREADALEIYEVSLAGRLMPVR